MSEKCDFCEEELCYYSDYMMYEIYLWNRKLKVYSERKLDGLEINYCPMCGKRLGDE